MGWAGATWGGGGGKVTERMKRGGGGGYDHVGFDVDEEIGGLVGIKAGDPYFDGRLIYLLAEAGGERGRR